MQLLLEIEAEVRSKNDEEYTTLHIAAEAGHGPVLQLLLEKGLKANPKDGRIYTLRMAAW